MASPWPIVIQVCQSVCLDEIWFKCDICHRWSRIRSLDQTLEKSFALYAWAVDATWVMFGTKGGLLRQILEKAFVGPRDHIFSAVLVKDRKFI